MSIDKNEVYRRLTDIGNNPKPDYTQYESIQEYVKHEVIQLNGRYKYNFKGVVFRNKQDAKNDAIRYIKEYDADCFLRKLKAHQKAVSTIGDMIQGEYALVFEGAEFDKRERKGKLYIMYKNIQNNELDFMELSLLEYRRKVFEIEDSIGMEIINFAPVYHVLKVKGIN